MTRVERIRAIVLVVVVLSGVSIGSYEVGVHRTGERAHSDTASVVASTTSSSGASAATVSTTESSTAASSVTTSTTLSVGASSTCTGVTQLQLNTCAGAEFAKADATLATVLADVRSVVSPQRLPVLDSSQRQWVAYRDAFCGAFLLDGGTIEPLNELGCKSSLTHQRIIDVCQWAVPNTSLAGLATPPQSCRPFHA